MSARPAAPKGDRTAGEAEGTGMSADLGPGSLAPESVRALAAQLDAGTEELALAGAMLGDAMRRLREGFARLAAAEGAAATADAAGMQQVMVALQAEDTLGQLLQAARDRQQQLALALREMATQGGQAPSMTALQRMTAPWGNAHCTASSGRQAAGAGHHEFF